MIEATIEQLIQDGWLLAFLRLLFIGLIYLFLFLVLRATVRELNVAARAMNVDEGRAARTALAVIDPAESALRPGAAIALEPVTNIGRADRSTIVVDDPHVSARHAELRFERGQWWLRDLGSSNGTMLNGEPVRAVVGVRAGDVIQCGRVRFRFVPFFAVPAEDASR
jgi:hypothetical protein